MTTAYGSPNISTQVSWFEAIVRSGVYTKEVLASSVALLSVAGNDYATYRGPLEVLLLPDRRRLSLLLWVHL
jgi:hypothetical protein